MLRNTYQLHGRCANRCIINDKRIVCYLLSGVLPLWWLRHIGKWCRHWKAQACTQQLMSFSTNGFLGCFWRIPPGDINWNRFCNKAWIFSCCSRLDHNFARGHIDLDQILNQEMQRKHWLSQVFKHSCHDMCVYCLVMVVIMCNVRKRCNLVDTAKTQWHRTG